MNMNTRFLTVAMAAAASMTLYAQAPQTTPPPQQPPDRPSPTATQVPNRATAANATMTITGCLKQEKDVPALKPSGVEKAGITDDYVLTNVKMSPGSSVSGIGIATNYEIEGIAEAELKKHLNHQVELTGQPVQAAAGAPADDAPDFKATSLKMVAATCNAAQ
jgi:hypothetical protein